MTPPLSSLAYLVNTRVEARLTMADPSSPQRPSAGSMLRKKRVEVLQKGLRETAKLLGVTPPHLTDIEKDRRVPSEALLQRIVALYQLDEAELRAAWGKAEDFVHEMVTQDPETVRKLPEFLRTARKLDAKQWDALIEQARKLSAKQKGGRRS